MFAITFAVSDLVDWLGTFAVHSTIALGGALLVTACLRQRAIALQEAMLRGSLWLAVLSATLQCVFLAPWVPEWVVAEDSTIVASDAMSALLAPAAAPEVTAGSASSWWSRVTLSSWILGAAAASAGLGLLWLGLVWRRLRLVLRARRPELDPRVLATAAEVARSLGLQQSPHVSRSAHIATPIAFGFVRPEICLPMRVGELSDGSLRAMLAHEVAHLRAADPACMWAAAWLQAMFPWQLLFVAVRKRWARLVELRCDAIAAEQATPTAVARCLLDVAGWMRPGFETSAVALGMAARASALRERVEAALRGGSFRRPRRRVTTILGGVALCALTAGAPAVATERSTDRLPLPSSLAPADDPMRAAERNSLQNLLGLLQQEHTRLVAEADRVRAELPGPFPHPQLTIMQTTLDRRLRDLQSMRARLEALLADPVSHR